MRVQLKKQEEQLAATVVSRDEAAACVRVVREERAQMKREWSEMFAAHDGLQQRIAALQRQVAEERTAAQVRPGWEGAGPCCVCCAARAHVLRSRRGRVACHMPGGHSGHDAQLGGGPAAACRRAVRA